MITAIPVNLPDGLRIRLIAGPVFLATKFESFATRGGGDMMSSHDFEDIINLLDGRTNIEDEIKSSTQELIEYLAIRFGEVASHPDFDNTLPGLITYDALYTERLELVRRRIISIAAFG